MDLVKFNTTHFQSELMEFEGFFVDITQTVEDSLSMKVASLMDGGEDDAGNRLDAYVEKFVDTYKARPILSKKALQSVYASLAINHLWKKSHAYIVMKQTSNCERDDTGANYVKVCDPDDPSWAYYLHCLAPFKEEEAGENYARVSCP